MAGHPRGRRPTPCRHCDMVDDYYLARQNDLQREVEMPMLFKRWLKYYRYQTEDLNDVVE